MDEHDSSDNFSSVLLLMNQDFMGGWAVYEKFGLKLLRENYWWGWTLSRLRDLASRNKMFFCVKNLKTFGSRVPFWLEFGDQMSVKFVSISNFKQQFDVKSQPVLLGYTFEIVSFGDICQKYQFGFNGLNSESLLFKVCKIQIFINQF